jgi:restriction endonuclease S subunit
MNLVLDFGNTKVKAAVFSETNEIDFSRLLHIKENVHNTLMANSKLQNGDILIAIVGATIGKVGVYQYSNEANINQAICAVRLKKSLNPYYVQAFLQTDIGQNIIARIKRPVARANINLEEVGSFPIPLLDSYKQLKIVDIMESGRKQKQAKETEAQQLLDNIDSYLLKELEINIPSVDDGLKHRIFFSSFNKIIDNRIDPIYSLYLDKNASSVKYDNTSLRSVAHIEKGNTLSSSDVEEGNIPVIAGGQTSPYNHNKSNYKGNIITVSASGAYAGYVWYHDYPIYATDCCVIFSKDESIFITKYLFEVLKLQQNGIYRSQTGAAQPHVYASDLQMLNIPVVSIKKQKEIVDYMPIFELVQKHCRQREKQSWKMQSVK